MSHSIMKELFPKGALYDASQARASLARAGVWVPAELEELIDLVLHGTKTIGVEHIDPPTLH